MLGDMRNLLIVFSILMFWTPVMTCAKTDHFRQCLPKDVQPKMVIQEEATTTSSDRKPSKPLSIEQKLDQLKAKCKDGKLVDQHDKEIRFLHLLGCWGNPPEDYQQQLDEQARKLQELKKKYTVIEVPCAQDLDTRTIH